MVENLNKQRLSSNSLLRDLTEIKEVLDVESQLIKALVRMAQQRRQIFGFAR